MAKRDCAGGGPVARRGARTARPAGHRLGRSRSAGTACSTSATAHPNYSAGAPKALGHRLPDVVTDDGERVYRKMPAGAILYAGNPTHPQELATELGLALVNGDVAALTRLFDRDRYVAVIQPTTSSALSPTPLNQTAGRFITALGRHYRRAHQPCRARPQWTSRPSEGASARERAASSGASPSTYRLGGR